MDCASTDVEDTGTDSVEVDDSDVSVDSAEDSSDASGSDRAVPPAIAGAAGSVAAGRLMGCVTAGPLRFSGRYPSPFRIDEKSSPEQPTRDVICTVVTKASPSAV